MAAFETIKLAAAREFLDAGVLQGAQILGQPGGYLTLLNVGVRKRVLATKTGVPRLFGSIDAAAKVLRDIGLLDHIEMNLVDYVPSAMAIKRPDRAEDMRQRQIAVEYDQWFRSQVEASLAKPNPIYFTSHEVHAKLRERAKQLLAAANA